MMCLEIKEMFQIQNEYIDGLTKVTLTKLDCLKPWFQSKVALLNLWVWVEVKGLGIATLEIDLWI